MTENNSNSQEKPIRSELNWLIKHLVTIIITSAITAGGTLITANKLFVQSVVRENQVLQQQVSELKLQVAILNLRLEGQVTTSPKKTISSFIDAFPRPAWCKYYDEQGDVFRMLHVNDQYEFAYNITQERYKDQTDESVDHWPDEAIRTFERNDRQVFNSKATLVALETVDGNGYEFWKFYYYIGGGVDMHLVCGIQATDQLTGPLTVD